MLALEDTGTRSSQNSLNRKAEIIMFKGDFFVTFSKKVVTDGLGGMF